MLLNKFNTREFKNILLFKRFLCTFLITIVSNYSEKIEMDYDSVKYSANSQQNVFNLIPLKFHAQVCR